MKLDRLYALYFTLYKIKQSYAISTASHSQLGSISRHCDIAVSCWRR